MSDEKSTSNLNYPLETQKLSLKDHGYREAGKNSGNIDQFQNILGRIKQGHLIDDGKKLEMDEKQKALLRDDIQNYESEIEKLENKIKFTEQIEIPNKEQKLTELKDEKRKKQSEPNEIHISIEDSYNSGKSFFYLFLIIGLLLYLFQFYTNCFHLIKNAKDLSCESGSPALGIDPRKIELFLWFTTLFVLVLFTAVAVLFDEKIKKNKYGAIGVAIGMLFVDISLVYYIEFNRLRICYLRTGGIEPTFSSPFYEISFYLALFFGYVAYLVLGYIFHKYNTEQSKKDVETTRRKKLDEILVLINEQIKEIEESILALKNENFNRNESIRDLKNKIRSLKEKMSKDYINISEIELAVKDFTDGWLRYLNGLSGSDELVKETRLFSEEFIKLLKSENAEKIQTSK